jgi:GT2 family glycosyltransferase
MPETDFNSLTVIIPTYNRQELLAKALAGYCAQAAPHLIHELLVIDDGSTDNTELMVQKVARNAPFPVRYLRQANSGPATARNFGIREAQSPLLLFSDSDIIPEPTLVAEHIDWHKKNPEMTTAVLGYVTWSPEIKTTPFMRWYGEDGALFAFRRFRNRREIDFFCLYTCNLSLKREFLQTSGQFDEEFKSASWEDVELGYRLHKAGLRLLYNPRAVAYHHQSFTFDEACRKARSNEAARNLFFSKEAGRFFLAQRNERMRGFAGRLRKLAATGVARIFDQSPGLVDGEIPLPSPVYRSLYWYRVNRQWEKRA